ncbi:unnamed protein product [Hapterophycus canaliculatus]
MAMISGLFHESEAKARASEERRETKYGGEQKIDAMFDLSEESLPGVLMKKIVRPGNGELPPIGSNVSVHYTGKLKDGTEFDTSAGRGPITFGLGKGEVIRGWDYAVSTMQKGERAILTVGPEYGYGSSATGPIPPNSTLTFEMEIVGWEKPPVLQTYQWAGLAIMIAILVYVFYFDDEDDILRKSLESSREL